MKIIFFVLMLGVASASYAEKELSAQQLVTWCETEGKYVVRIAEYKRMGFTHQETNRMILDGNLNISEERSEKWLKWLVTVTSLVYKDPSLSPEEWRQLAFNACIERLTEKK